MVSMTKWTKCAGGGNLPTEWIELTKVFVNSYLRRHPPPAHTDETEWRYDCIGEALLAACKAYGKWDKQRSPCWQSYLRAAVDNALCDWYRQETRYLAATHPFPLVPLRNDDEEGEDLFGPACISDPDAQEQIEQVLRRVMLDEALASLTEEERTLALEVWVNENSQRVVSEKLGISQPALSQRLGRIRKKLLGLIEGV